MARSSVLHSKTLPQGEFISPKRLKATGSPQTLCVCGADDKQLDDLSAQYQKNIDEAYATLDQMYETYQSQKGYLSEINRNAREEEIIKREKDIKKYQQEVFGPEGDLIKKRLELIKPIQERVFAAINQYAETNQITMVIDRANNQTLLYYAPALDKTNAIITLLKQ